MKTGALVLCTGCLLALAVAALRFVYVATPRERLLTIALLLACACCLHRRDGW